MTFGVICYLNSHFGEANSILMSNPKTHGSLLTTHYSSLITQNLSYLCHLCAITHSGKIILQNHNKVNSMLMRVKETKRQLGRKKCPTEKKYVSSWKNLFS